MRGGREAQEGEDLCVVRAIQAAAWLRHPQDTVNPLSSNLKNLTKRTIAPEQHLEITMKHSMRYVMNYHRACRGVAKGRGGELLTVKYSATFLCWTQCLYLEFSYPQFTFQSILRPTV